MTEPRQDQADFLEQLGESLRSAQERITRLENESFAALLAGGADARLGAFSSSPGAAAAGTGGGIGGGVGGGVIQPTYVIAPGAVDITSFASTISAVRLVSSLPALPDAAYPIDTFAYNTTTKKLYKNVADVWEYIVGPGDISANEILANTITAGEIAAGAIGATEIAAGAITTAKLGLVDGGGTTLLDASGFGPTWQRFITGGTYAGDFRTTPPTPGNDIDNSTNPQPYWSFVKRSGTAITARNIADTGTASGREIQFTVAAGAAGDDSYIEQIVPVNGSRDRAFSYIVTGGFWTNGSGGLLETYVSSQQLEDDLTPIGSEEFSSGVTLDAINSANPDDVGSIRLFANGQKGLASNAYFLRIRFGFRRGSATTGFTGSVRLVDTSLSAHPGRLLVTDTKDSTETSAQIVQTGGRLIIGAGLSTGIDLVGVVQQGGSSFPTITSLHAVNDQFYRTDLGIMFGWDGTSWTCICLHTMMMHPRDTASSAGDLSTAITASQAATRLGVSLPSWATTWRLEFFAVTYIVNSGGTALGALQSWVENLQLYDSAGSLIGNKATITINSGASGTFRRANQSVGASLETTGIFLQGNWTKTGTPGSLQTSEHIGFRYVITP